MHLYHIYHYPLDWQQLDLFSFGRIISFLNKDETYKLSIVCKIFHKNIYKEKETKKSFRSENPMIAQDFYRFYKSWSRAWNIFQKMQSIGQVLSSTQIKQTDKLLTYDLNLHGYQLKEIYYNDATQEGLLKKIKSSNDSCFFFKGELSRKEHSFKQVVDKGLFKLLNLDSKNYLFSLIQGEKIIKKNDPDSPIEQEIYKGCFVNHQLDGEGIYKRISYFYLSSNQFIKTTKTYQGNFREGQLHGKGEEITLNESVNCKLPEHLRINFSKEGYFEQGVLIEGKSICNINNILKIGRFLKNQPSDIFEGIQFTPMHVKEGTFDYFPSLDEQKLKLIKEKEHFIMYKKRKK